MDLPAGWHPDPADPHFDRYWDGKRWTARTRVHNPAEPPGLSLEIGNPENGPAGLDRGTRWVLVIATALFGLGALILGIAGYFGSSLAFAAVSVMCAIPGIVQPHRVERGRTTIRTSRWLPLTAALVVAGTIGDGTGFTMSSAARHNTEQKAATAAPVTDTAGAASMPESAAADSDVERRSVMNSAPQTTVASSDPLDCTPPTVEVLTFDWRQPATASNPRTAFERGMVEIRITNNSRHNIKTSGASFNMAWREPDGSVVNRADDIYDGQQPWKGWDTVPSSNLFSAPEDRVDGHDAIGYTRYFGMYDTFITDGTEPWVHQRRVGYQFENPDLQRACGEQRARLGQSDQAEGHTPAEGN